MKLIAMVFAICFLFVIKIECFSHGIPAQGGQFPYQVSVRNRYDNNRHIGGGAIITATLIITSASVVYFVPCPKSIYAVAGSIHLNDSGTFIGIEKCAMHPSFEYGKIANDIALLHAANHIIFTECVQPVMVPPNGMPINTKVKVNAPAWGDSPHLTFRTYRALSLIRVIEDASQIEPQTNESKANSLILSNSGICSGDLGNPLINEKGVIIGLMSSCSVKVTNLSICAEGYPHVYTQIYVHSDWVARGNGKSVYSIGLVRLILGIVMISTIYLVRH